MIFHRLKNEFISSYSKKKILDLRKNTPPGRCWKPLHWCWEIWAMEPGATHMTLYFIERLTKCSFLKLLGDRSLTHLNVIPLVLPTEPTRAAEPEKTLPGKKTIMSFKSNIQVHKSLTGTEVSIY